MDNWSKLLSDLAITTEKPIDPSLIYFAMLVDLYKTTKSVELKETLEKLFISQLTPRES